MKGFPLIKQDDFIMQHPRNKILPPHREKAPLRVAEGKEDSGMPEIMV